MHAFCCGYRFPSFQLCWWLHSNCACHLLLSDGGRSLTPPWCYPQIVKSIRLRVARVFIYHSPQPITHKLTCITNKLNSNAFILQSTVIWHIKHTVLMWHFASIKTHAHSWSIIDSMLLLSLLVLLLVLSAAAAAVTAVSGGAVSSKARRLYYPKNILLLLLLLQSGRGYVPRYSLLWADTLWT